MGVSEHNRPSDLWVRHSPYDYITNCDMEDWFARYASCGIMTIFGVNLIDFMTKTDISVATWMLKFAERTKDKV